MKIDLQQIIDEVRSNKGELPYVEIKMSNNDVKKIGETLSAIYNSALYFEKPFAYMIWGYEDDTWKVKGTTFDIHKDGKLNQILGALNIKPDIYTETQIVDGKKIFILQIKPIKGQILAVNKAAYIRLDSHNSVLFNYPDILRKITTNAEDWSAKSDSDFTLDMIDEDAYKYLFEKYFSLSKNVKADQSISKVNLLNKLGLLKSKQEPNNSCIIFLGKTEVLEQYFPEKAKITWKYKDDKNSIEERLDIDEVRRPFILLIPRILDEINRFNTTITELNLFRSDIRQYDRNILEEALINAVVHRDWTINLWIEVLQTPDSLEIRNPGMFRADLDKVIRENQKPEYLNPKMSDFLQKLNLMEKEAGGLKKIIATQKAKGLSTEVRFDNNLTNPRVDLIFIAKVRDVRFARFISDRDFNLTEDQIIILDKIYFGKNILGKDITDLEYSKVSEFVTKSGQGGIALKIKELLISKSQKYIEDFSNTYTSSDTSRQIILEFANKEKAPFSTNKVYVLLKGKSKSTVRKMLMKLVQEGYLQRVKIGVYRSVPMEQTKLKRNR